jgi:hypothetical protein
VRDGGLGELAVVRAGTQAPDQGENPGGHLRSPC